MANSEISFEGHVVIPSYNVGDKGYLVKPDAVVECIRQALIAKFSEADVTDCRITFIMIDHTK